MVFSCFCELAHDVGGGDACERMTRDRLARDETDGGSDGEVIVIESGGLLMA